MDEVDPGAVVLAAGARVVFERWEADGREPRIARGRHEDGSVELYLPDQLERAGLAPLRWRMDERVALSGRDVHRAGCDVAPAGAEVLDAGSVIERQDAPRACPRCQPRLEMLLPGDRR
jgi:hypothetical protein